MGNHKDANGESALIHSYRAGRSKLVSLLLQHRADPDSKDAGGRPLLMLAAAEGKRGKLMLEQQTALHLAIRGHHHSCVHQLLEMGASPHTAGPKHMSPLIVSCAIGSVEATRLLMAYDANPLWVDQDGFNAAAHSHANPQVLKALQEFGYSGPRCWKIRRWCKNCCGCFHEDNKFKIKSDNSAEAREAAALKEILTQQDLELQQLEEQHL